MTILIWKRKTSVLRYPVSRRYGQAVFAAQRRYVKPPPSFPIRTRYIFCSISSSFKSIPCSLKMRRGNMPPCALKEQCNDPESLTASFQPCGHNSHKAFEYPYSLTSISESTRFFFCVSTTPSDVMILCMYPLAADTSSPEHVLMSVYTGNKHFLFLNHCAFCAVLLHPIRINFFCCWHNASFLYGSCIPILNRHYTSTQPKKREL